MNLVRDCLAPPVGIELAEENAMPEQPADPIHYEMKIPPEPKHTNEEKDNRDVQEGGAKDEKDEAVNRAEERAGEKSKR